MNVLSRAVRSAKSVKHCQCLYQCPKHDTTTDLKEDAHCPVTQINNKETSKPQQEETKAAASEIQIEENYETK